MKAKKPTAARKPAAKAKKVAPRKPKAPARASRRPVPKKKKAILKKVSPKKVRKTTKAKRAVRAKVKQTAKPIRAGAKKKTVPKTAPKTKPVLRRVPIQKLLSRPTRRRKRIIKLPAFLRRPARKIVRRIAPDPVTAAPEIEPSLEAGAATSPVTPQTARRIPRSAERRVRKAVLPAKEEITDSVVRAAEKTSPLTKVPKPFVTASTPETDIVPEPLHEPLGKPTPNPSQEGNSARERVRIPVPLLGGVRGGFRGTIRERAFVDSLPETTKRPRPGKSPSASEPVIALPAILFEGDHPEPSAGHPAIGQSAQGTSTTAPPPHATGHAALPEAYGTQHVTVTARDPHWLYVHWDLTREQLRHYNAQSVHRHLVLRLHENQEQAEAAGEFHVHPESRHWFVHVPQAAVQHIVELGYYRKNNGWVRIAVSTPTATPAATPAAATSVNTEVRFATIPHNVTLPRLAVIARTVSGKTLPLVDAIQTLRATGHPELPPAPNRFTPPMTPEMESALVELICRQHPAFGVADSAGISEMLHGGLTENSSSLVAAGGGGISSLSSPHGGAAAAPREFWFNLNAELVIYGATEPDASVTIGGRPVMLRPDGSFSCRFALPDGHYELPVTVVSADGTEARHADLKFTRATNLVGEVGQHPQDPALKTPTPENM